MLKKFSKKTEPKLRIALAGNPNSGKTTLFNVLTGSNQHIGNWPGVTVSLKSGRYKGDKTIEIVDLPGIYGLEPISKDEIVSRDYIINEKPDLILNIADATNLERSLYLTSELLALDTPVVLAINMCDEAKKAGYEIDIEKLSKLFNINIVKISAKKKQGIKELMDICSNPIIDNNHHFIFSDDIEKAVSAVSDLIDVGEENRRFHYMRILERDKIEIESRNLSAVTVNDLDNIIKEIEEKRNDGIISVIATERFDIIHNNLNSAVNYVKKISISDKIDRVITNKWLAFPIFALVMWAIFFLSIQSIGGLTVTGMEWLVEWFQGVVSEGLLKAGAFTWLHSLIVDGIISGVGAVIIYVPQIMLLFGLISALEACGYMTRVAYIMDALLSKIGLSGKSFIPMIIGCGCSVPAIMGARTIKNERERDATIMLVPFIPCSAKLPIFSLFTTMIFGGNAFAATSMYFIGIIAVIVGGLILKVFNRKAIQEKDTFVMELPPYRIPSVKNVLRDMWDRGKSFLIKAGTIIFLASIILWFLQSFNYKFQMVDTEDSLLAVIGRAITPIFAPLGFGQWQLVVATLTGSVAKEAVVATMEILGVTGAFFTTASAYSFMTFNLLFFPCIAAVTASFKELSSRKKGFIAIMFQILMAYGFSLIVYWAGVLFIKNMTIFWSVFSIIMVLIAVTIAVLVLIKKKKRAKCGMNCAICAMRNKCNKTKP